MQGSDSNTRRCTDVHDLPLYYTLSYTEGIVSGAMLLIVKDLGLENNTFEQELIVSATLVGCIVASVGSKTLTEGAGRRTAILVAAFTFTVGAAVMWVARATPNPFYCLVAGRFIVGLGVGLASMVTPLYIGEVGPASSHHITASSLLHSSLADSGGVLAALESSRACLSACPSCNVALGVLRLTSCALCNARR